MRQFLFLLVFFFSGAAFAQEARPPLWRVADEDTTIYLFGTIHLLKPGTVWMTDDIQSALTGSQKLYLEVSPAEQADAALVQGLVQKYGVLPEGQSLSDHLPAEDAAALKEGLISLGLGEAAVERFKPWFAGTTFSSLKFLQLGYNPASGVEAALGSLAQARGIPVDGLETMEDQLSMFDSMSPSDTKAYVRDLLNEQDKLSNMMTEVTESWAQGDLKALDEEINDVDELSPTLAEKIIYARNRTWAGKIKDMLAQPGQIFIAVGSGHFVGDRSVIDYLEERGVEAARVQ